MILDWQVTIAFYTSLHVIQGHLAESGIHPLTHEELKRNIASGSQHSLEPDRYAAYRELEHLSRRARYLQAGRKEPVLPVSIQDLVLAFEYLDLLLVVLLPEQEGNAWERLKTTVEVTSGRYITR